MDPLPFHRHRVFRFQGCRSARRQSAHAMLWTVVKEAAENWSSHKDSRQGAALAYYSVFSLGPVIVIAIAVAARSNRACGSFSLSSEVCRDVHAARRVCSRLHSPFQEARWTLDNSRSDNGMGCCNSRQRVRKPIFCKSTSAAVLEF
jgi:hypothetical protein